MNERTRTSFIKKTSNPNIGLYIHNRISASDQVEPDFIIVCELSYYVRETCKGLREAMSMKFQYGFRFKRFPALIHCYCCCESSQPNNSLHNIPTRYFI